MKRMWIRRPSGPTGVVVAISIALISGLCWAPRAQALGWTQPEDGYYVKLWDRSLIGDKAYTASGELVDFTAFQDHQLGVYAEYGWSERVTLVAHAAPLGFADADRSTLYVGPLNGGVRLGLLKGRSNLALETQIGVAPGLGDRVLAERDVVVDGEAVTARYVPAVGNVRGELQLQLGVGFEPAFVSAGLGLRGNSNSDIDHAVVGYGQIGVKLLSIVTLDLHCSVQQPLGEVTSTNVSGVGNSRFVGFGLGAAVELTSGFGVTAGLDGALQAQSNAGAPSLQLGVYFTSP